MASISVSGTGGGIDVSSFVTQQQLTVEKPSAEQPRPTSPAEPVQTKLSTEGKLQSAQSSYQAAAEKLAADMSWANTLVQSSQASAVSASADNSATAGDYSIEVNSLATAQATASASFSGVGTVIGLGTLHIELGGMNSSQTAFSTNPNWPKSDVRLGPHDNSLEKIRDKINAAGVGVVASVISDATGSRLVLRSTSTGADNGFKVTASGEGGKSPSPDLAALGFDPALAQAQQSTVQTQAAADAKGKVNGVAFESSSNTVSDVVQGLSFKLGKVTDGPVKVSVGIDQDAVKKSITEFTQSYNELNASGQAPAVPRQRLADIGIEQDAGGALRINSARLDKALGSQAEKVRDVFAEAASSANRAGGPPAARDASQPPASYTQKLLDQYKSLESDETAAH